MASYDLFFIQVLYILELSSLIVAGVLFSFTPSPNITILQSAVYQCVVGGIGHGNGVNIVWNVNGISSSSPSWQSYISSVGIVADGIGTWDSTLIIPGDPILNETIVTCIASGLVNGEGYINSSSDTLYIQGIPGIVRLDCSQMSTNNNIVKCNWTVPYTIEGVYITEYRVNLTDDSDIPVAMTIQDTQFTYSICNYTNVSVAAVIDELEGEIVVYNISEIDANYTQSYSNELIFDQLYTYVTVEDSVCGDQLPKQMILSAELNATTTADYYTTATNITSHSNKTGVFSDIPKGKLRYLLALEYHSGLRVKLDGGIDINTFDVQDMIITGKNPVTGHVCFNLTYIFGIAKSPRCFLEYNSSIPNTYGSLTINTDSICTTINHYTEYTVMVYDIVNGNTPYTVEPAITIATTLGKLTSSSTLMSSSVVMTTITMSTHPSVLPSNDAIPNLSLSAIIGASVFGINILIGVIIPLTIYCKKRSHMRMSKLQVACNGPALQTLLQQHDEDSGCATLPGHISEHNTAADDVLTYRYVVDNVVSRIPHKWEEFGRAVVMTPDKIQEIRNNHPNSDRDTFCDIILEWQSSQTTRPFTIETLNLVMNTIGEE